MERARALVRRHWPALRLRTILLATLVFVAALPGVGAVSLRVYENTLVRQTEAELVAQGTALSAAGAMLWPGRHAAAARPPVPSTAPPIDLRTAAILPERPASDPPLAKTDRSSAAFAARLAPILDETRAQTLAGIVLLDAGGRILVGGHANASYARLPEVRAALAGRAATVLRRNAAYRPVYAFEWLSRAAAIRVHHARPILVGDRVVGVLLLSRTARALFRGLYEDRGKIAVGALAILAVLIGLAALLSRGIARPIERLSQATRDVAAGRGTMPPVPQTAAIEIQALHADFAAMAAAVALRSRYLRDFAYAVSHEFKTPLAGINGAVELLRDHQDTMEAGVRARFLGNVAADAARLNRLVSRLLDLARADMARSDEDAVSQVAPTIARVADAYDSGRIAVAVAPWLPPAAVAADALETCLAALVDNAWQAGATHVSIDARRAGPEIEIDVADDGPGISAADRIRIFEPFFTTRRAEGGTGLGLSIVASLLHAHEATVALVDADAGTCFRLTLPIAA